MKRMSVAKRIWSFYGNEWGRYLICFTACALLFYLTALISPITFLSCDDTDIMNALGGYISDEPSYYHVFINPALAMGISSLYDIAPSINWYTLAHLFTLFVSVMIVFRAILKLCYKKSVSFTAAMLICFVVYAVLFAYQVMVITFTKTGAVAGAAAIALVLVCGFEKDRKLWFADSLTAALLIVLACLWRNVTGYCAMAFFVLALLYKLYALQTAPLKLKRKRTATVRIAALLIVTVSFVGATFVTERVVNSNEEYAEFYHYNSARALYMDYPHETYDENPELYEDNGIDETLYELISRWFFIDESVSSYTFEQLSDVKPLGKLTFNCTFLEAVSLWWKTTIESSIGTIMSLCAVLGIASVFIRHKEKHRVEKTCIILAFVGCAALELFLCLSARFPERTKYILLMPALLIAVLMNIQMYDGRKRDVVPGIRRCLVTLLVAVFVLTTFCDVGYFLKDANAQRINDVRRSEALAAYAMKNRNSIFIYDNSLSRNVDAFVDYTEHEKPSNLIFWGGCGMNSPANRMQLERNRLRDLKAGIFLSERVYYVTLKSDATHCMLLLREYMIEKFGKCFINQVACLDGDILILQFTAPERENGRIA